MKSSKKGDRYVDTIALLRRYGLSVTKARIGIISLLEAAHGPFTADQILEKLDDDKLCDRVTVYRVLETLEQSKIVRRCIFGDAITRYELVPENDESDHHHHILCRICNKVEVLEECFLKPLEKLILKNGYSELTHHLEFIGVCSSCSK